MRYYALGAGLAAALFAAAALAWHPWRTQDPPVHSFARDEDGFDWAKHPGGPLYQRNCATCHEGGLGKAPHREFLEVMAPEAILAALNDGVMRGQAAHLDASQRRQVTEYLTHVDLARYTPAPGAVMCGAGTAGFDLTQPPAQAGWGYDNRRFVPQQAAGLTAQQVPRLRLKWAYAFPAALRARSEPLVAMNTVFVGSQDGTVYAFDLQTGCARWTRRVSAEVRTRMVLEPWEPGARPVGHPRLFFGDLMGRVYAMDALTGRVLWSVRPVDHPNVTITGTPALHGDTLYVPVSSLEVVTAADPTYACCTFRGAVLALDVDSGVEKWRTYTVDAAPAPQGKTRAGTPILGPSGAPVWNSPTVDAARGAIYFGSGENYSSPADGASNAVFAVDWKTGQKRWRFQTTAGDAFNAACMLRGNPNCPAEQGPDLDIGASVLLVDLGQGRERLVVAPKSGMLYGLDPQTGKPAWQIRVGRGSVQGGVHFGLAAEGRRIYAPIADSLLKADGGAHRDRGSPGLRAVDAETGEILWSTPAPDGRCGGRQFCESGVSAAVTAIPGVVFAGHLDGWLRAYDGATGAMLWETDTTQPVRAVNGVLARGGSMSGPGPAVAQGYVITNSGYGFSHHMPGNALLVYSVDGD